MSSNKLFERADKINEQEKNLTRAFSLREHQQHEVISKIPYAVWSKVFKWKIAPCQLELLTKPFDKACAAIKSQDYILRYDQPDPRNILCIFYGHPGESFIGIFAKSKYKVNEKKFKIKDIKRVMNAICIAGASVDFELLIDEFKSYINEDSSTWIHTHYNHITDMLCNLARFSSRDMFERMYTLFVELGGNFLPYSIYLILSNAAEGGNLEVIKYCNEQEFPNLKKGSSYTSLSKLTELQQGTFQSTPLLYSVAAGGNTGIIEYFLNDSWTEWGTMLAKYDSGMVHYAAANGHQSMLDYLYKRLKSRGDEEIFFKEAMSFEDLNTLQYLVSISSPKVLIALTSEQKNESFTRFERLIVNGDLEIVEYLFGLAPKLLQSILRRTKYRALQSAISFEHVAIVQYILKLVPNHFNFIVQTLGINGVRVALHFKKMAMAKLLLNHPMFIIMASREEKAKKAQIKGYILDVMHTFKESIDGNIQEDPDALLDSNLSTAYRQAYARALVEYLKSCEDHTLADEIGFLDDHCGLSACDAQKNASSPTCENNLLNRAKNLSLALDKNESWVGNYLQLTDAIEDEEFNNMSQVRGFMHRLLDTIKWYYQMPSMSLWQIMTVGESLDYYLSSLEYFLTPRLVMSDSQDTFKPLSFQQLQTIKNNACQRSAMLSACHDTPSVSKTRPTSKVALGKKIARLKDKYSGLVAEAQFAHQMYQKLSSLLNKVIKNQVDLLKYLGDMSKCIVDFDLSKLDEKGKRQWLATQDEKLQWIVSWVDACDIFNSNNPQSLGYNTNWSSKRKTFAVGVPQKTGGNGFFPAQPVLKTRFKNSRPINKITLRKKISDLLTAFSELGGGELPHEAYTKLSKTLGKKITEQLMMTRYLKALNQSLTEYKAGDSDEMRLWLDTHHKTLCSIQSLIDEYQPCCKSTSIK